MDDCLAYSETFTDHLQHLEQMLEALRQAGLKLNPDKCQFGVDRCRILGVVVSVEGSSPCPEKVQCIVEAPRPTCQKHVRAWYGLCSYYRRWIKNFSGIARPLSDLLRADMEFKWDQPKKQRSKR